MLDEQAREDFFRLKKLTDKKKKAKELEIREKELGGGKAKAEGEEEEETEFTEGDNGKSAIDAAIGEEGTEDLIF